MAQIKCTLVINQYRVVRNAYYEANTDKYIALGTRRIKLKGKDKDKWIYVTDLHPVYMYLTYEDVIDLDDVAKRVKKLFAKRGMLTYTIAYLRDGHDNSGCGGAAGDIYFNSQYKPFQLMCKPEDIDKWKAERAAQKEKEARDAAWWTSVPGFYTK